MKKNRVLLVVLAGMLVATVALLIFSDVDEGGVEPPQVDSSSAQFEERPNKPIERLVAVREQATLDQRPREQVREEFDGNRGPGPFELVPGASISGRVIDGSNVGLADVVVRLLSNAKERRMTTDDEGSYSFVHLAPGIYRLYVEPASLEDGFLPPWRQHVSRAYSGVATGLYGTSLRITDAGPVDVDLRVFRSSTVSGRVIKMDGDAVTGALVMLSSKDGRKVATRTAEDGSFAIARVYPGLYSTIIDLSSEYPDSKASAPTPFEVSVTPGSQQFLRDILVGAGGYVLTGRVIDQRDVPMAGMVVSFIDGESSTSTPGYTATTDLDGYFRVGRFPSAELRITVEDTEVRAMRGDARLVAPVEIQSVFVSGSADEFELGDLRVERLYPFLVRGEIRVDPKWAESSEWKDWSAEVLVSERGGGRVIAEVYPTIDWRPFSDEGLEEPVELKSASFYWGCPTPSDLVQVAVVISDGRGGQTQKTVTVEPKPDESLEVLIEFP